MPNQAGTPLFEVGQTCYVPYEDGAHYQGRVTKREIRDSPATPGAKMWFYLVHYMGWNKKFDEWVEEPGMSTVNPNAGAAGPKSAPKNRMGAPGAAGKTASPHPSAKPRVQMSLAIPAVLKKQLVEDHDAVKGGALVPLPRRPCVNDILEQYVATAAAGRGTVADEEQQVANGLRSYFDRALALILLYVEERSQADAILEDGKLPSSAYGAEHLLRLFVKLPDYLPVDNMLEAQYKLLQEKLHDVLAFMKDRQSEFFLQGSAYEAAKAPQP